MGRLFKALKNHQKWTEIRGGLKKYPCLIYVQSISWDGFRFRLNESIPKSNTTEDYNNISALNAAEVVEALDNFEEELAARSRRAIQEEEDFYCPIFMLMK